MNLLREKIEEILKKENYTFKQLADYLNISEGDLENGLQNKTLELRYLEQISKTLKVPLYSFFRDHTNYSMYSSEKPYYTNKLWNDNQNDSIDKLKEDIILLKELLIQKEAALSQKLK
jgi:transcriptional regulator with XRE-family HTH domain